MKVMLVDEEGALRLRLGEALLETAGIELTLCPPDCGPEHDAVFAQVRRLVPDVVVLDVSMPAGGALGLIGRIKSLEHSPAVIAVSAASSAAYRTLCGRAGAEYFFDLTREREELTLAMSRLKREMGC